MADAFPHIPLPSTPTSMPHHPTELRSARSSRAGSVSSAYSAPASPFAVPDTNKSPPMFVAAAAASEMVADFHRSQLPEDEVAQIPEDESARFSEDALVLVNAFLDYLLYSFFGTARSSSLNALRPAITEVLKPKLAREAIHTADEELQELSPDGQIPTSSDDDDDNKNRNFTLEHTWKRTRLRIMVYTRLGDLEDEDEDQMLADDDTLGGLDPVFRDVGLVSAPAAIFLTSIIEFLGEQVISAASQAAWARVNNRKTQSGRRVFDRLVVEDYDVEKLALNSTLGRLWRTWRKRVRTPGGPNSPPVSRQSVYRSPLSAVNGTNPFKNGSDKDADTPLSPSMPLSPTFSTSRRPSEAPVAEMPDQDEIPEHDVSETDIAANISLPVSDNDVDEIEVPGLSKDPDATDEAEPSSWLPLRRVSSFTASPSDDASGPLRPLLQRLRSRSVPHPERKAFCAKDENVEEKEVDDDADADNGETGKPEAEGEDKAVADTEDTKSALDRMNSEDTVVTAVKDDKARTTDPDAEGSQAEAGAERNVEGEQKDEEKPDHENQGYVAGAVAGASSMVAAGAAMIFGRAKDDSTQETKSEEKEVAAENGAVANPDGTAESKLKKSEFSEAVESSEANNKDGSKTDSKFSEADNTPELIRTTTTDREAVSAPDGHATSIDDDGPEAIGLAKTSDIAERSPSITSPTMATKPSIKEIPTPSYDDYEDIGVARTSDVPIPAPRTPSPDYVRGSMASGIQEQMQGKPRTRRASVSPPTPRNEEYNTPPPMSPAYNNTSRSSLPLRDASLKSTDAKDQPVGKYNGEPLPTDRVSESTNQLWRPSSSKNTSPPSGQRPTSSHSKSTRPKPPPVQTSLPDGGVIVRPSSSNNSVTKSSHSKRGSESSVQRVLDPRASTESRQRDFDTLIKSEATVKHSLTPQKMIDIERSTPTKAEFGDIDSPPVVANPTAELPSPSTVQTNGMEPSNGANVNRLSTAPPNAHVRQPSKQSIRQLRQKAQISNARPPSSNTPYARSGFAPREPRVTTQSLRDLADFLRSTAPDREQEVLPIATTNRSPANGTTAGRSQSPANRMSVGPTPGVQSTNMAPRAPVRDYLGEGSPRTAALPSSTSRSGNSTPSRSNLAPPPTNNSLLAPPDGAPIRKRRRVKDPYAIDTDDEEDDMLTALPSKPGSSSRQPEGESLMDFLRNTEPPVSNQPAPVLNVRTNGTANGTPNGTNGTGTPVRTTNGAVNPTGRARSGTTSSVNSNGAAVGGTYTPSGAPSANGTPRQSTSVAPSPLTSNPTDSAKSKAKLATRSAGASRETVKSARLEDWQSTADLADFFRSSGPDPLIAPGKGASATAGARESSPVPSEDQKQKKGRFWRKKNQLDA
ncbi:hypothetical protein K402DRAFT_442234 [Aulographum hederae CBS 113979]|uniref:Uncharacterized protein n=1 Tax=Aulographum hederae CBS 113979 TaxID=1176131 RepID=A0A6G1H9M4_9PEZI|nr:hypothetical protein K402DRAFT_442234 [Aulographum hederae CBS 113979]